MPCGSMTAASAASLTLCLAQLSEPGERPAAEARELDRARCDAFAWLSQHRAVRQSAGADPSEADSHGFYWLYSLERACELSRVAWIGDWDWYYEGAEMLLAKQRKNGDFDVANLIDNCFALLFLKKAQLPVLTGPRQR